MRALVLGGTGMLGRAVAAEVRRRGGGALALSRLQADITDGERLRYWAQAYRPTVVVNCAAFTRVDDCESDVERAHRVNGAAVAHVVEAARQAGARLLHVSTDYVFSGEGLSGDASSGDAPSGGGATREEGAPGSGAPTSGAPEPYREEAPTGPRSVYGASKLRGEHEALEYSRALVLRVSWLFGPGGGNFAATMAGLIAGGQRPLRVVADQHGCPTYTPYAARALCELAERDDITGLLHYRNREPTTWHGFATEIAAGIDPAVEVQAVTTAEFPRPAPRPAYSVLDVSRFERLMGRRVESWMCGLQDYAASGELPGAGRT